ncbi:MAG: carbohydrate-binding protein [Rhizobiaceae bacterium]|nr:carbohydrate-binding protein [Rhizobiaceae bacterium]
MDAPDGFRCPASPFRPGAFWFWHHIPGPAEIVSGLAGIARSGLGTIMIQARLGLSLDDYLSPAFLDAYRFACAEAARLGISVEIYDEYNWMSGHGGGRTVEGADHLRERHLFWLTVPVRGGLARATFRDIRSAWLDFLGDEGRRWCYEGGEPLWDEWQIVAAAARGPGRRLAPLTRQARIVAEDDVSCTVEVRADAEQSVTVFVSARCRTSRLINYLMPEAAERYAELVYGPLLDAAGGGAKSVFFDHPYAGFYRWRDMAGDLGNSLLWDRRLPALLGTASLELQLCALTEDVGPDTAKLRAGFFRAYGDRLHEAFFGTLRGWCDARGIGFSGHELLTHVGGWGLHDGLTGIDPRSMPGVDYFGVDRYRTATSVDAADYRPQLAARLGDSVARANGRSRCTLEQYSTGRETGMPGGAGQWGLTLQRLRAQAIRHTLQGARRVVLHALYLTDGFAPGAGTGVNPRFDFAPGFNFEPWWQDVPDVFDELARLSVFVEEGEPVRPVALLYPLETIRAEGPASACGRHFGLWAEAMTLAGIGFDVIDESGLAAAEVSNGQLRLPSGRYAMLVLPAVGTLAGPATAAVIGAFAGTGGRLAASGGLPRQTRETGFDASLAATLAALPCSHVEDPCLDTLAALLGEVLPPPPVRFEAGPTFATTSRLDGTQRLALFNDQPRPRVAGFSLGDGPVDLSRWHPETGAISSLAQGVGGAVRVELAAHALLCVEVRPARAPGTSVPAVAFEPPPPVVLGDGWSFSAGGPFRPVRTDMGWERQGFATFAGTGIYRRDIDLPPRHDGRGWSLVCPGLDGTAECIVDGGIAGRHVAGEAVFPLPGKGRIAVELRVRNTAANRYYSGTVHAAGAGQPSGLTAAPRLELRAAGDIRILSP